MKNIILIFILSLGLYACNTEKKSESETAVMTRTQTNPGYKNSDQKIVYGTIEKKIFNEKVQSTGSIVIPPTNIFSVHSKVNGTIEFMKYLPGDYVKKGTLLFKIFNPDIVGMERQLLESIADLTQANNVFNRKKKLYENSAINDKEFQSAQAIKNRLEATVSGLTKELSLLGIDTQQLIDSAVFQTYIPVYSKLSGFVQEVYVNKGQMVSTTNKLMDIANNDQVQLELNILAKDVPLVQKGQKVNFTLPKKSMDFQAEIVKLNPMLNEDNGTRTVYCRIDNDDYEFLLPGMFINASIETKPMEFMGLSSEGFIKEGEDYYVYRKSGKELIREKVSNPVIKNDYLVLEVDPKDTFVLKGAYYIE